jgi:hypothetical protein
MNVLERDVVIGTFTHTTKYLEGLIESVKKHHPEIPFVLQIADLPINRNFEELRRKFRETGKRFWVFLDHDIRFVRDDTITTALLSMLKNRFALVGIYSTYYEDYIAKSEELVEREIGWVPGYFQMVDSQLVGNVSADLNLPFPNIAIDTSYCVTIKALGNKIGIAPTYIHHVYKPLNLCNLSEIDASNVYLRSKWGQYYYDVTQYCGCIVGNDPGIERINKGLDPTTPDLERSVTEIGRRVEQIASGPRMKDEVAIMLKYGKQCKHITEFGVEYGKSAMLWASCEPDEVVGYDIKPKISAEDLELINKHTKHVVNTASSLDVDIVETDMLFVDSLHTYDQVLAELSLHASKAKKFIMLHDMFACGVIDELKKKPGLLKAMNDFLASNSDWGVCEVEPTGNGVIVLKREGV